jgi:hypothetical protein
VHIPFDALQKNETLCSVIVKERDFQEAQVPGTARMSVSSVIFSDSSGQQLSWLTPGTAFVRDDSRSGSRTVRWRLAEEFSTSSRQYSKTIIVRYSLGLSRRIGALTWIFVAAANYSGYQVCRSPKRRSGSISSRSSSALQSWRASTLSVCYLHRGWVLINATYSLSISLVYRNSSRKSVEAVDGPLSVCAECYLASPTPRRLYG